MLSCSYCLSCPSCCPPLITYASACVRSQCRTLDDPWWRTFRAGRCLRFACAMNVFDYDALRHERTSMNGDKEFPSTALRAWSARARASSAQQCQPAQARCGGIACRFSHAIANYQLFRKIDEFRPRWRSCNRPRPGRGRAASRRCSFRAPRQTRGTRERARASVLRAQAPCAISAMRSGTFRSCALRIPLACTYVHAHARMHTRTRRRMWAHERYHYTKPIMRHETGCCRCESAEEQVAAGQRQAKGKGITTTRPKGGGRRATAQHAMHSVAASKGSFCCTWRARRGCAACRLHAIAPAAVSVK